MHSHRPAPTERSVPVSTTSRRAAEKAGQPVDEFVRESIVDPDAMVGPGFQPGVMPKTFGQSLTRTGEIDALVTYLTETK